MLSNNIRRTSDSELEQNARHSITFFETVHTVRLLSLWYIRKWQHPRKSNQPIRQGLSANQIRQFLVYEWQFLRWIPHSLSENQFWFGHIHSLRSPKYFPNNNTPWTFFGDLCHSLLSEREINPENFYWCRRVEKYYIFFTQSLKPPLKWINQILII